MSTMYVPRLLEKTLKDAIQTSPAVFIGGPRQSGKTTLVKSVLKDKYHYVSLDELDVRSFALHDPRGFLDHFTKPLIIDEIQNAPQLLSYIKARIDQDRKPGQWILTGSQQWALMQGISETLAGRIAILHLYPFSLEEINEELNLNLSQASPFLDYLKKKSGKVTKSIPHAQWLLKGGYPEVLLNDKISKKLWFSSYVQTYIDRDVRGNVKNSNLHDFERFLRLLASRTAQELHYSALANDIGVTVPTIKSWVSLLEASGLIYLLMPYHRNFGKRIIKAPKCYFMDTGLVCYLVGLQDEEHLLQGPMAGALFETACVTQFFKRFSAFVDPSSLYYYRSTDGLEVDLIIEIAKELFPVEIKLSSTIKPEHASPLKKWLALSGCLARQGMIISTAKNDIPSSQDIFYCHYSRL